MRRRPDEDPHESLVEHKDTRSGGAINAQGVYGAAHGFRNLPPKRKLFALLTLRPPGRVWRKR